jgi:hypothetical protein
MYTIGGLFVLSLFEFTDVREVVYKHYFASKDIKIKPRYFES